MFFELPFFTPLFSPKPLEKFTDKHTTHISAQKICSTNKYRIQGHNNFKVLNRSGLEATTDIEKENIKFKEQEKMNIFMAWWLDG